jgi:hypothetical protein
MSPNIAIRILEKDFNVNIQTPAKRGLSIQNQEFIRIVEDGANLSKGHYTIPLPFKHGQQCMSNNKHGALKPFCKRGRCSEDQHYWDDYVEFVSKLVKKGYAEIATAKKKKKTLEMCDTFLIMG